MFFYRARLFSLFGFDVYVDASWLLLAVLMAWSLAVGVFPSIGPGLTSAAYWSMPAVATVGLLFSIVFHEMSVTTKQVSDVGEDQWGRRTVAEIMEPCNTISPETDALEAMTKMQRTGRSPLLVVDRGQLVGILSLRDLLEFLTLKLQFEGSRGQRAVQPQEGYGA
jgi:hypothetical protein